MYPILIYAIPLLTVLIRIGETLPNEVLTKMHAPAKPDYPIIAPSDLANFDAFIFGVPTRYGNFPAQWKVRRRSARVSKNNSNYMPPSRRLSGTQLVVCGSVVVWPENSPVSSFLPAPPVEDRKLPSSTPFPLSLTMELSTFPWVTKTHSHNSPT